MKERGKAVNREGRELSSQERHLDVSEDAIIKGLSPDAQELYAKVLRLEKGKLHVPAASTSLVEEMAQLVRGLRP